MPPLVQLLNEAVNSGDLGPLRGLVPDADLDLVAAMQAIAAFSISAVS